MERPATIEDLKSLATEKFGVEIVNIREMETEAEVHDDTIQTTSTQSQVEDTAAIKPDSIVWALTEEDETEFD